MSYGLLITREVKNGLKKAIEKVEKIGWLVTIILKDEIPDNEGGQYRYPSGFEEYLKKLESFIKDFELRNSLSVLKCKTGVPLGNTCF